MTDMGWLFVTDVVQGGIIAVKCGIVVEAWKLNENVGVAVWIGDEIMLGTGGGWFNDNGSDIAQGVDRLHYVYHT